MDGIGNILKGIKVKIGADLKDFDKAARQMEQAIKPVADRMKAAGETMTKYVTVPLAGLAGLSLHAAARFEQLSNGLTAVMGSSEATARELELLKKAAEAPGLGFEEAVKGSVALQSVGFSAETARRALEEFGNAIAISGGTADDLAEVSRQLSQIQAVGKLTAENWNVIAERAPIAGQALQEAFGTKSIEAIRQTGISTDEFIERLIGGLSKLERANGGLANAFENLQISGRTALSKLGDDLNKTFDVEGKVKRLTDTIDRMTEGFAGLSPETKAVAFGVGLIAAATGPVLQAFATLGFALPGIIKSFKLLRTAVVLSWAAITSPVGIVVAAIAAAAAAAYLVTTNWEKVERFFKMFWAGLKIVTISAMDTTLSVLQSAASVFSDSWAEAIGRVRGELALMKQAAVGALIAVTHARHGFAGGSAGWAGSWAGAPGLDEALGVESSGKKPPSGGGGGGGLKYLSEYQKKFRENYRLAIQAIKDPFEAFQNNRLTGGHAFDTAPLQATADMLRETVKPAIDEASESVSEWSVRMAQVGAVSREVGVRVADDFGQIAARVVEGVLLMEDGFRSLRGILQSFGDMAKRVLVQLIADLAAAAVRALAIKAIFSIFGLGPTPSFGSLFASGLGFGGFRAAGGPVAAGTAYMVGERGPELFVPRQSGTVVPSGGGFQAQVLSIETDYQKLLVRIDRARAFGTA